MLRNPCTKAIKICLYLVFSLSINPSLLIFPSFSTIKDIYCLPPPLHLGSRVSFDFSHLMFSIIAASNVMTNRHPSRLKTPLLLSCDQILIRPQDDTDDIRKLQWTACYWCISYFFRKTRPWRNNLKMRTVKWNRYHYEIRKTVDYRYFFRVTKGLPQVRRWSGEKILQG